MNCPNCGAKENKQKRMPKVSKHCKKCIECNMLWSINNIGTPFIIKKDVSF